MRSPTDRARREDIRAACRRDSERFRHREAGHGAFWRSVGVLGAVGWPIVLLAAGGAALGHRLDARWDSGVRMTLMLLFAGVLLGIAAAWQVIQKVKR